MAKTHAGAFAFGIGAAFPFPGIRNFDSRVEGSGFFRNHLDIPSSPLRREHDDQGIRCANSALPRTKHRQNDNLVFRFSDCLFNNQLPSRDGRRTIDLVRDDPFREFDRFGKIAVSHFRFVPVGVERRNHSIYKNAAGKPTP